MAMHWRELLDLADRIASQMDDEAARRAAASRAYYAVFHGACERLKISGYIGHKNLVEKLFNAGNHRAARLMQQAMHTRVHADYFLDRSFSEEKMRDCIACAKGAIRAF